MLHDFNSVCHAAANTASDLNKITGDPNRQVSNETIAKLQNGKVDAAVIQEAEHLLMKLLEAGILNHDNPACAPEKRQKDQAATKAAEKYFAFVQELAHL